MGRKDKEVLFQIEGVAAEPLGQKGLQGFISDLTARRLIICMTSRDNDNVL
jgi:hypothetical protein